MVIADYLAAHITDQVFAVPGSHSSAEILVATYAYAVQIYADFSGYTDMAIGLALLLGFVFPQNFDSPYAAVSLQDFWRRWHMTLSRWLRDYLYIPLGGNRRGRWRTSFNLMATMLLGGLWHGAAWTFVDLGRHPRRRAHRRALVARAEPGARPRRERVADLAAAAADVQPRLPRLDLLPLRLARPGLADALRPVHALGSAVAARDGRRRLLDRGRDRDPVPPRACAARDHGALRRTAACRSVRRPRRCDHARECHGPSGRLTVHLLPLLMASRHSPARGRPGSAAEPVARSARTGAGSRPPAGRSSSRCCAVLGLLLDAPGLHKTAFNQPPGWKRTVALDLTGPLAGREPRDLPRPAAAWIKDALGRGDEDRIDTAIVLPPPTAAPGPRPTPSEATATTPAVKPKPKPRPKPAFTPARKLSLGRGRLARDHRRLRAPARAARATRRSRRTGGVDGQISTGLARPDVFNWFTEIRPGSRRFAQVVVLCFGANDDTSYMTGLPAGVRIREYGDAAWRPSTGVGSAA